MIYEGSNYTSTNEKLKKLIEQIVYWKRKNYIMYPNDILNYLIEYDLISISEAKELIDEYSKTPLDIHLPREYID
jgi:DNA-directed RNA polymerase subunit F